MSKRQPTDVFPVDYPCPKCGKYKLFGYYYTNDEGEHQQTHYVCTSWPEPEDKSAYMDPAYNPSVDRCGWHDWMVPEPRPALVPSQLLHRLGAVLEEMGQPPAGSVYYDLYYAASAAVRNTIAEVEEE